jgi:hypothetical protein
MESLAVLVLMLFLIDILAGPIAIALTWPKLVKAISARSRGLALVLTIIRRLVHGLLIAIGLFIGSWLVNIAETPAKLLGLFSIITSYIALRREYFPDFYILARLLTLLGIKGKEEPRIYSADGTEIIRAKNVRRFGRTSGRDGHGPGGQH